MKKRKKKLYHCRKGDGCKFRARSLAEMRSHAIKAHKNIKRRKKPVRATVLQNRPVVEGTKIEEVKPKRALIVCVGDGSHQAFLFSDTEENKLEPLEVTVIEI